MKVLITGGTGTISSGLVKECVSKKYETYAITRGLNNSRNIAGATYLKCDVWNVDEMSKVLEDNQFDVVSIYDGTVTKVEDNELAGKTVEVKHDGNIISVYQSLGEVKVKVGDTVKQGDIIATSGQNKITTDTSNALHFEVFYKGEVFNPEEFYLLDYTEVMNND